MLSALQALIVLVIAYFVIPHLEMRACDWSKLHHETFTKSGYFPQEAILPPRIDIASMSSLIFLNNS